jgi:dTDP-4-amino-4,6-dideoxy-D-galactose acyltransferase
MKPQQPEVQFSPLDEERFGVRTAKAFLTRPSDLTEIVRTCQENGADWLIARCPADRLDVAHTLESAGARLTDVLVYFVRKLGTLPIPAATGAVPLRSASPADAETVAAIAREAFCGYQGHYHADTLLDRTACDEVYVSWARRSCLHREVAHAVLIAVADNAAPAGFITLRLNSANEAEICLNAVRPAAQRRGVNHSLILGALNWGHQQGCERVVVSTQVTNIPAQKVWVRLGFEPHSCFLTFHLWFNPQARKA